MTDAGGDRAGGIDPTTRLGLGIGLRPGAAEHAVRGLLIRVAERHGLHLDDAVVATLDRRAGEPGLRAAVAPRTPVGFTAAELAAVTVPHPSGRVAAVTGTPSVAEAAALLAAGAGAELVVGKISGDGVTIAVAACGVGLGGLGAGAAGRYPRPSPSRGRERR